MPIDLINDSFEIVTVEVGIPGTQGPAGPQGDQGPAGETGPANTLSIGSVSAGNTGDPAEALITGTAPNQVLNLVLPRGEQGEPGPQGEPGVDGAGIAIAGSVDTYAELPSGLTAGDAGDGYIVQADGKLYIWSGTEFPADGDGTDFRVPEGPANTLTIGTVTTTPEGSTASASITGTAPNQVLSLSIPRGDTGATGPGIISGGAAGAVLAKASASDFDTEWTVATASPTVSTIIKRDSAGRAQVVAPAAGSDIANKTYVDDAVAAAANNNATVDAATSVATPSTLMKRDINGRAQVADPVASSDIATKNYADGVGTAAATASTVMRRDTNGRAKVADPSVATDIANKQYVDAALAAKANLASPTFTGTVSGITKSMVGLGNVDNTTDADKPVSTATQTALNAKADASETPMFVRHNGVTDPDRPNTTRPVIWIVPDANKPATNGATTGGSYAAVNNLDIVWGY